MKVKPYHFGQGNRINCNCFLFSELLAQQFVFDLLAHGYGQIIPLGLLPVGSWLFLLAYIWPMHRVNATLCRFLYFMQQPKVRGM